MSATFDKKAYAQQINALALDDVQDAISAIDERTYTDLQKREVLIARRKDLAMPMFEALAQTEVLLEHWKFELTQMQKPSTPHILTENRTVFDYIVETHPEMLTISKENLIKILNEIGMSEEDKTVFLMNVCKNTSPTVKAKRIA